MLNTTPRCDTTDSNTDHQMSTTSDTVAYTSTYEIRCEKCEGTGYQQDNNGIWHICPICEGTGIRRCKLAPCEPRYPLCDPWAPVQWQDDTHYENPYRKYVITCC